MHKKRQAMTTVRTEEDTGKKTPQGSYSKPQGKRSAALGEEDFRSRTHAYLSGICKNLDSPSLRVGGTEDHVHIACRLSRKHSIAELVKKLKEKSSKWIKEQQPSLAGFYWQAGTAPSP